MWLQEEAALAHRYLIPSLAALAAQEAAHKLAVMLASNDGRKLRDALDVLRARNPAAHLQQLAEEAEESGTYLLTYYLYRDAPGGGESGSLQTTPCTSHAVRC